VQIGRQTGKKLLHIQTSGGRGRNQSEGCFFPRREEPVRELEFRLEHEKERNVRKSSNEFASSLSTRMARQGWIEVKCTRIMAKPYTPESTKLKIDYQGPSKEGEEDRVLEGS